MIKRLLIANRGEIACRIARTAHRLGMETVGVFSEADRGALHTRVVDRAVCLGGTSPGESYLDAAAVLAAARRTGSDVVHPGYGFLAENAAFARDVEGAGLIWVGPTPTQIELLGDKVAAKAAAVSAGVPTTEAVVVDLAALADPARAAEIAAGLPCPAMVKAAAGGGGRGMRVVADRVDFPDVVASASREARAAFGDGSVFVEPLIVGGRHVEVQVLGDTHGNIVHLGERDCSIQRRHQKVIEEAPSPGIDGAVREALCAGAVSLAQAVGYRGAGTVEYLVGGDGTISFLEVNTRLQVEHPVTEAVWGVDLVELQLLVAAGGELPFAQADLSPSGHAIEARLVAEDPAVGWMPAVGTVGAFAFEGAHDVDGATPRAAGIRVDSGVAPGSVVGPDYDSLLAKVISYGSSRQSSAAALARALRGADLNGVRTNADTLAAICCETAFLSGDATTDYLDQHPEVCLASGPTADDRLLQAMAAMLAIEDANRSTDRVTGFAPSGWRNVVTQGQRITFVDSASDDGDAVDDEGVSTLSLEYRITTDEARVAGGTSGTVEAEVLVGPPPEPDADGVLVEDTRRHCEVVAQLLSRQAEAGRGSRTGRPAESGSTVVRSKWSVQLDGIAQTVQTATIGDPGREPRAVVQVNGAAGRTRWIRAPRFPEPDAAAATTGPVSPLPGSVVSVHVAPGDTASDGDLLVVVEAMKMEHRITARGDVTIAEVHVSVGDKVDAGEVLVTFATSD